MDSVVLLQGLRQLSSLAAVSMTEQPFSGSALLTPHGEGARKGALNIVCLLSLTGLPCPEGSPLCDQKIKMNFGTWNVRTLLDNTDSKRPERRTAVIARELRHFKIDIAALQETRRAGEGQLKEEKGGYTFFWKGLPEEERRIHRVGFAVRNDLVKHLTETPTGINERLSTFRINLAKNQQATIICAYAPTLDANEDIKENFYCQLDTILSEISKEDKIIFLVDFNARVGQDSDLWPGIIGKDGVRNRNSNGILLLTKCGEHNLVITNTLFRQKNKLKTSWKHPWSKHWHLLDYVITRARDRRDVLLTRAMTGANDCLTDHRLIGSTMAIKIAPKRRLRGRKIRR
uniref:Endonuclease/exonuclease/phosphatase domain-containing protein n=1 Tax=Anolis carolinensis TaxID=28377 RepID=G1KWH0_ANOCA